MDLKAARRPTRPGSESHQHSQHEAQANGDQDPTIVEAGAGGGDGPAGKRWAPPDWTATARTAASHRPRDGGHHTGNGLCVLVNTAGPVSRRRDPMDHSLLGKGQAAQYLRQTRSKRIVTSSKAGWQFTAFRQCEESFKIRRVRKCNVVDLQVPRQSAKFIWKHSARL